MTSVGLRLSPRRKVQRIVELMDVDHLADAFEDRIRDGYLYGDCQFSIDPAADDFLRIGIFSCYRPVDPETPIPPGQRALTTDDWGKLLYLTHADKARAAAAYTAHYLATSGQIYWSDLHQMSDYIAGYHRRLRPGARGARGGQRDHHGDLRPATQPGGLHVEGARRLPRERRRPCLRDHQADGARRRERDGVGP